MTVPGWSARRDRRSARFCRNRRSSRLATREQMAHIHSRGGRFLSILPRSRAEDGQIREWAQTHAFDWTEAARRPAVQQTTQDGFRQEKRGRPG
jgi:hypothetical protein